MKFVEGFKRTKALIFLLLTLGGFNIRLCTVAFHSSTFNLPDFKKKSGN